MTPIDNLLRRRLRGTQKPSIEHPPVDLLSAFAEKALSGFEHDSVIKHLANCDGCRELAFLAAPEFTTAATHFKPPSTMPRWSSSPVLRWASIAACAVMVFAVVRLRPEHPPSSAVVDARGSTPASHYAVQGTNPPSLPKSATGDRVETVPGKAKEPEHLSFEEQRFDGRAVIEETSYPGFRAPRWTLTAEGKLERSLDDGVSWSRVPVPESRKIRVIAADGTNIWVGGERGALLHSPDAGQHWRQLRPVVGNDDLIADIIAIQFDDTQHGMLTTFGDGTWMTSDGGSSWQKQ